MLQGYLFKHVACLQEPSKTDLKPILDGWMDGWMMDGWMDDGWMMDGWMDG